MAEPAREPDAEEPEELPAWSLPADAAAGIRVQLGWPAALDREWAFGGATGAGARVCILDSGIEVDHPLVGEVQQSWAVSIDEDDVAHVDPDDIGDKCGHGTACAGIVRS